MTSVPAIFRAVAAWAEGRPFGDPAGMAVRELLHELTGPPRIGVCTVDAPVQVVIPGAIMVRTTWPAVGSGADVILLVHPGDLPGRVRSRMRTGPQKFVHIEDKEQAENYTIGVSELVEVREQLLSGGIRALATRFPQLTALVPAMGPAETPLPRVVVIGPDPGQVDDVRARLRPHVTVVESADADVVVAVPGGRGFMLIDAPIIQDAWHRVGRLVVLSPLPAGMCPQAVPAGSDLVDTIARVAGHPAGWEIPVVPTGKWIQAHDRMRLARQAQIHQLHRSGDRRGMRELAKLHGEVLPPEPRLPTGYLAAAAGLIVGVCVIRVDLLPVVLGIVGMHVFRHHQRRVRTWWDQAAHMLSLDTTSEGVGHRRGPFGWVHEQSRQSGRVT
ncbi:hypothetical protein CFAEC_12555 [Corynebacterium faecale]|uniref:hypothetical protein n=1 Tax=Corynebacterium faecale TaxID=1758466 RepID=UPI0025B59D4A|nr:hypothetical protein [Corynebacterium faecale]WJY93302.1 hypothetical protein CFAEC_12555 [Corynebacterium faecale]